MMGDANPVAQVIAARRSVRRFDDQPVDPEIVRELVALACTAPAPHHSRPWRFINIASRAARERLAEAMRQAWLEDLQTEGKSVHEVDRLLSRSSGQVEGAPVLLLACLAFAESREWPDAERRAGERDMFMQSLGASLQNILLAAHEAGLAGYLKGAPLFCGPAVRQALGLPADWQPAFLVLLGYAEPGFEPPPRPALPLDELFIER